MGEADGCSTHDPWAASNLLLLTGFGIQSFGWFLMFRCRHPSTRMSPSFGDVNGGSWIGSNFKQRSKARRSWPSSSLYSLEASSETPEG